MRIVETDLSPNANISSATLVGTYTADEARRMSVRLFADQVAGNGTYTAYLTIQLGGTGSEYRVVPITDASVASGVTAFAMGTIPIDLSSGDVLRCYLDGLAGDTTTPDVRVEWWEDDSLRPATAGQHSVAVDASGYVTVGTLAAAAIQSIWDRLTSALTTAGSIGKLIVDNLDAAVSTILSGVSQNFTSAAGGSASVVHVVQADTWAAALTVDAFTWAAGDKLLIGITSDYLSPTQTDAASTLQWLLTNGGSGSDGLTYINETAAGADRTKGSLSVTSAAAGTIVANLDETISAQIARATYRFSVVHISSAGVRTTLTRVGSQWVVQPTTVRTTS